MTSDFERVNAPRVAKAVKFVESIEKSRKSYRVTDQEHSALLEPLREALGISEPAPMAVVVDDGGDVSPINMDWVKWALEHVIYGKYDEAIEMLKKGLNNEKT